jgi:hypothetical protein
MQKNLSDLCALGGEKIPRPFWLLPPAGLTLRFAPELQESRPTLPHRGLGRAASPQAASSKIQKFKPR